MFIYMPISRPHECKPLPIDKPTIEREYIHSADRAGYDVIDREGKTSQCVQCGKNYPYDFGSKKITGFISYIEYRRLAG